MRFPLVHQDGGVAVDLGDRRIAVGSFRDFYAFEQHVMRARRRRRLEMIPEWYEMPVFYFSNHRSLLLDGENLVFPRGGARLDYELEVACVIGREGRDIPVDKAERHILGYTILNDWSLRDVQHKEMKVGLGPAKGKDFATSIGPAVVSADEFLDRRAGPGFDLRMRARVNGRQLSDGSWASINYSFAEMIARASVNATLFPGDLIGSGTIGSGCILELGAESTGGWLKPGDHVELEIARIGTLHNTVVAG